MKDGGVSRMAKLMATLAISMGFVTMATAAAHATATTARPLVTCTPDSWAQYDYCTSAQHVRSA
ncbi:MAG TPA: hypothetical protein VF069_06095 [Streptosporangiaceae bacterium]